MGAFAAAVEARVGEIWRLVCEDDVVVSLPPAAISCRLCFSRRRDPYVHVGTEVLMTCEGSLAVNPCFAEGHLIGEVKNSMALNKQFSNHYHCRYGECLRNWISNIHPEQEGVFHNKMMPLPNW